MSKIRLGMELEAIIDADIQDSDSFLKVFNKIIPNGTIVHDDTIITDLPYQKSFEWVSPILPYCAETLDNILMIFDMLPNNNIIVNDTCGVHFHISREGMTRNDLLWVICKLSQDDKIQKKMLSFCGFEFSNDIYADKQFLDNLHDHIRYMEWDSVFELLTDEKHRTFRLHPQGTLEWRGPRNFLSHKNHELNVKFVIVLKQFLDWFNDALDSQELLGMSRTDFDILVSSKETDELYRIEKEQNFSISMTEDQIEEVIRVAPWLLNAKFRKAKLCVVDGQLVWIDGEWQTGEWFGGLWHDGTWINGTWHNGVWKNGNWQTGTWFDGTWHNGIWEDGVWHNGTWFDGKEIRKRK